MYPLLAGWGYPHHQDGVRPTGKDGVPPSQKDEGIPLSGPDEGTPPSPIPRMRVVINVHSDGGIILVE